MTTYPQVDPVELNGYKQMAGLQEVPNDLLSGASGGSSLAEGALGAAAGPWGALAGGVASALAAPMPSLTATVTSTPSVRYGDRYMENLVGSSKTGQFNVTSGSGNPNAENRGAPSTATGLGPSPISNLASMPLWVWAVVGVVALIGLVIWRKK